MSDDKVDNVELKLDGHIYFVKKDVDGKVLSEDELDGDMCLKLLVAILDDASNHHILNAVFAAVE